MSAEFVDTNILLYAYDTDAGTRHDQARQLVSRLGRARSGVLSVQVLQEFYVNAVAKIAVPLTPEAAQERLRVLSRWTVHAPLAHDVIAAAQLATRYQLSFWDSMIVHSARESGCTVLWTEDLNAGQRIEGLEIRNPFAPQP